MEISERRNDFIVLKTLNDIDCNDYVGNASALYILLIFHILGRCIGFILIKDMVTRQCTSYIRLIMVLIRTLCLCSSNDRKVTNVNDILNSDISVLP